LTWRGKPFVQTVSCYSTHGITRHSFAKSRQRPFQNVFQQSSSSTILSHEKSCFWRLVSTITTWLEKSHLDAANGSDLSSLKQRLIESGLVQRRPLQHLFQQLNNVKLDASRHTTQSYHHDCTM